MKIITRYIGREFMKIFAICFSAFVMLYLMVDFFEKIDDFIEAGATGHSTAYFICVLPFIGVQMVPMAVLMATIITLGILSKNNEIIAMKANGIDLFHIGAPLFAIALSITAITFVTSEFIVPSTNRRTNHIWKTFVKKSPPELIKHERLWYKGKNAIYSIRSFNPGTNTLEGIIVNKLDKDFRLACRIQARSATWENGEWLFSNGVIKKLDEQGSYTITPFTEKTFLLAETPPDFKKAARYSDEMGFTELRAYAKKIADEGYDATKYLVDMHIKLAFPFICVLMSLIGVPLALRNNKGGIATGIGISFIIILLYMVTFVIAKTLGYSNVLPPFIAAWFANLLFGAIGLFLLINTR